MEPSSLTINWNDDRTEFVITIEFEDEYVEFKMSRELAWNVGVELQAAARGQITAEEN
jgi:hypothetical protein